MKIIDAFCGVGPWAFRDRLLPYRPEEILELMDYFGVEKALVYANMAVDWGWQWECNRIATDAARLSSRFIPAFALAIHAHRDSPSLADYAGEMRRVGAKAVWLFPRRNRNVAGMWEWYLGEVFALCESHRVPIFLHGDDVQPDEINTLCSNRKDLRVVLAGAGYASDHWLFPLLRRHANLHVCLGHFYIPPSNPMRFLDQFDADRLIFGSGLPHFSPGGLIGHVMYADIPDAVREKIFSGNLERLMGEVRL